MAPDDWQTIVDALALYKREAGHYERARGIVDKWVKDEAKRAEIDNLIARVQAQMQRDATPDAGEGDDA